MSNISTIREVEELLFLLRESLRTRVVAYVGDDVAVCECVDDDPGRPTRPIAWIDDTGSARELLNEAYFGMDRTARLGFYRSTPKPPPNPAHRLIGGAVHVSIRVCLSVSSVIGILAMKVSMYRQ
jgi:hypothetical protein